MVNRVGLVGVGTDGFVRTVNDLTVTGDLVVLGKTRSETGSARAFWETADANAHYWAYDLPSGTSTQVPVIGIGIGLSDADLGLFDGITQPTLAVLDADSDSFIALDYSADDAARLRSNTTINISPTGSLSVGTDGSGNDVVFYSGTSGDNLTWSSASEALQITGTNGQTSLDILDGDVRIVDTLYFYDRGGESISSDGSTLTIAGTVAFSGNISVSGTTTTVNSTTVTIDDPIFTLGGDTAPDADDNKDRGIEFRYYDSQARLGFFGYDDSATAFTGYTAATNSSEVFSGTVINAIFGDVTGTLQTAAQTNITSVGALDGGSITSNFGTIDTGASTITTTGLISGGSLDIDSVLINGTTIGHTDDTDLLTVADGILTLAGQLILDGNRSLTPGDGGAMHLDTHTVTDSNTSGSGTATKYTHVNIEAPTLAATNSSVTTSDAATLYINNAATAGSNQTITRNWAMWIDAGNARFDGSIYSGTTEAINSSGLVTVANQSNITGVGTIASGTWEGTTVAVDQGGTGATTLNNLITLTTHTTGNYVATVTAGTGLTSTGATSGEGIAHSLSVDTSQTQIVAVGALDAGSITSSFGNIDNGSSTITTTGTISGGGFTLGAGKVLIDGDQTVVPGDGAVVHVDAHTITDGNTSGSGTATKYTHINVESPTLAATNSSVTTSDAATVYIQGAITAGSNQTLTRNYALWVDAGAVRLDGTLQVGVDGSGVDVVFYSGTAGDNLTWDASEEVLNITGTNGATALDVLDGDLRVVDNLYLYDRGGEKIASDGTDLTISSGAKINLTAASDVHIPKDIGLVFDDDASEKIESNDTDLTIASGAKINLTSTSDVHIANGTGLVIGHTAQASTAYTAETQILGTAVGTDSSLLMGLWSTTAGDQPMLQFLRSTTGSITTASGSTEVQSGDSLGAIKWYADDSTNFATDVAEITVAATSNAGENNVPGKIVFKTNGGAATSTARWSMLADGEFQAAAAQTVSTSTGVLTIDGDDGLTLTSTGSGDINVTAKSGQVIVNPTATASSGGLTQFQVRGDLTLTGGASNQRYIGAGGAFGGSIIINSGGDHGKVSTVELYEPNIDVSASNGTVVYGTTLYIGTAPTEGTTANYALWIDAGASRFDGAISLAADHGDDGQQLTSGGDDAACDWTAASSLREHKYIGDLADPDEALQAMLGSKAYHFRYKEKHGTGDSKTEYIGLMADESPWAMHYKGKIVNPVNTLGYTVLAVQALYDKIEKLESQVKGA